ncbi:MAG: UDP-N-acetylmuramoyl-L-alanyl-D-glutamate--2,6-diaminopimelate ligase [Patescibacteria group bacterium]|nr:UDP-N-acetylmuramoyl-L-alanyl-D-glutamate--2,6-diaminopimelate ligase [Patescibacteria group bacterium]
MNFKKIIKKITPQFVLQVYHWLLGWLGAFLYGCPSRKLKVIGVTGTKGKSSTVLIISHLLEQAGFKVGISSGIKFKIDQQEWPNNLKMTMPGRFKIQQLLKKMVKAGCDYAIVETTSEGIKQFRHLGINYDIAVLTNLTPEHIESHGSFVKYRQAKEKLFKNLTCRAHKKFKNKKVNKVSVINLDDQNAEHFLKYQTDEQYGFKIKNQSIDFKNTNQDLKIIQAENLELDQTYSKFKIQDVDFKINLIGVFNVYNVLASLCVALSQGIELNKIKDSLLNFKNIPGRLEEVVINQPFRIFVDYAHEPSSLESLYQTLKLFKPQRIISLLGSAGGGRDKNRRPILGALAAQYTDVIIVTNEDPYDEDPQKIIDDVAQGVQEYLQKHNLEKSFYKILDRRQAIQKSLALAQEGDIIVLSGKGCENVIMGKNNQPQKWSDKQIILEEASQFCG